MLLPNHQRSRDRRDYCPNTEINYVAKQRTKVLYEVDYWNSIWVITPNGGWTPNMWIMVKGHLVAKEKFRGIPTVWLISIDGIHMYGHGSYKAWCEVNFSATQLSLLNRGMAIFLTHVRGGAEMGQYIRYFQRNFCCRTIYLRDVRAS